MSYKRKATSADQSSKELYGITRVKESASRLRILIVGCGLGGLVTAIACKRSGHEVTILEQSPELREASTYYW